MKLSVDLSQAGRIPVPWRPCTVYVVRCDASAPRLVVYNRQNPRGTEYPLADVARVAIAADDEWAEIVIPPGLTGRLEVWIQGADARAVPTPITMAPVGGRIASGELTVTEEPITLPDVAVMPGREVVIVADDNNTDDVYVNDFALPPGTTLMVSPARLSDISVRARSGTQRVSYIAEVRA